MLPLPGPPTHRHPTQKLLGFRDKPLSNRGGDLRSQINLTVVGTLCRIVVGTTRLVGLVELFGLAGWGGQPAPLADPGQTIV